MREIRARGTQDILIVVVEGLKGFPEAITSVFPETVTLAPTALQRSYGTPLK